MQCGRCGGDLHRDKMYDLPRSVDEYCCLNCGERFWQKLEATVLTQDSKESNPIKARASDSAARRAQTLPPEEEFTFTWAQTGTGWN